MHPTIRYTACAALLALAGRAAAQSPASPSAATRPAAGPAQAPRFQVLKYSAPLPRDWTPEPPSSSYRAAQYRVPAAKGAAEGEVVVFYFGKGQGGPVEANVQRWTSQFSTADGKPVQPKLRQTQVNGLPTTRVELSGHYARNVGMGAQGAAAKPDQTLLVAIVQTPDGNVTFQLHGDKATVERHRKAFDAMVGGFR
jgi:hypothetical protein